MWKYTKKTNIYKVYIHFKKKYIYIYITNLIYTPPWHISHGSIFSPRNISSTQALKAVAANIPANNSTNP